MIKSQSTMYLPLHTHPFATCNLNLILRTVLYPNKYQSKVHNTVIADFFIKTITHIQKAFLPLCIECMKINNRQALQPV